MPERRGRQPKKSVYHPFWDFYRAFFYFSPAEPLFYFRILQFMTRTFPEKTQQGYRTFLKLPCKVIRLFRKFPGRMLMIVLRGYRGGCRPRTPTGEECRRPRRGAPAADQGGSEQALTPIPGKSIMSMSWQSTMIPLCRGMLFR